MKAIKKEELIKFLNINFNDKQLIFQNDHKLELMWENFAEDWFIEDGRWTKG